MSTFCPKMSTSYPKTSTFFPKTSTTDVSNHDHNYTVDVSFSNDDDNDDDVQTLGKFSVKNPNGHSWSIITPYLDLVYHWIERLYLMSLDSNIKSVTLNNSFLNIIEIFKNYLKKWTSSKSENSHQLMGKTIYCISVVCNV